MCSTFEFKTNFYSRAINFSSFSMREVARSQISHLSFCDATAVVAASFLLPLLIIDVFPSRTRNKQYLSVWSDLFC